MDTTRWGGGQSGPTPPVPRDMADMPVAPPMPDAALQDPDNPFEEPENAPELRQQRSDSLYTRSAPFWERVVEPIPEDGEYPLDAGYWQHKEEMGEERYMRVEDLRPLEKVRRYLTSRTALWFYLCMVVVLVGFLAFRSVFGTIRTINVVGNTNFTTEQVIALSGLEVGMSTFDIEEDVVMARISRERYLRCTLVDVALDMVTLHVRERVPCCTLVQNGRRIILDDRGWVLEVIGDVDSPTPGLIQINGLDVHHCSLGQAVTLRIPGKLTAYTQILIELRALGGLGLIAELDMTAMDSITLKTTDGLTVSLGDDTQIHQKIRAMLVVRENLLMNDFYGQGGGGTIVVVDPGSPAYRPQGL